MLENLVIKQRGNKKRYKKEKPKVINLVPKSLNGHN